MCIFSQALGCECVSDLFDGFRESRRQSIASQLTTDCAQMSCSFRCFEGHHYVHFFRTEQRKYDEAVTGWERARYFERG